jgi:glutamyl-tRNA(Gln) amidotransferase subunit E
MPQMEMVTYPDLLTPDEAAEAAHYLRFLARSTGKVRTGIGAAREDVNVSVSGGTRVEIKGVAHIAWIPELVHNEAFRQKALLEIRDELKRRIPDAKGWKPAHRDLDLEALNGRHLLLKEARKNRLRLLAVNLPGFRGVLSFFTQPGRTFADEIADRLKVIACLEKPNLLHSEPITARPDEALFQEVRRVLKAEEEDAQILFWAGDDDVKTALETIDERCRLAFQGVPNETRKGLADGTTLFERVLPGPDRMYPDTDSAPIPIEEELIERLRAGMPVDVHRRFAQFREWGVPRDAFAFLLKHNLAPLIERIHADFQAEPRFVATLLAHDLKHLLGKRPGTQFQFDRLQGLFAFLKKEKLERGIARAMLPVLLEHPNMDLQSVLTTVGFRKLSKKEILAPLPLLRKKFGKIAISKDPGAEARWLTGQLRKTALGNLPLRDLAAQIDAGGAA